jgi:hypothetical protein
MPTSRIAPPYRSGTARSSSGLRRLSPAIPHLRAHAGAPATGEEDDRSLLELIVETQRDVCVPLFQGEEVIGALDVLSSSDTPTRRSSPGRS